MMKLMQNILIALLLLGLGEGSSVNLTFMFITSFGQSGHNSSGAIPAAEMALEAINSNPSILPGYSLGYDDVKDSEVSHSSCCGINRFVALALAIDEYSYRYMPTKAPMQN